MLFANLNLASVNSQAHICNFQVMSIIYFLVFISPNSNIISLLFLSEIGSIQAATIFCKEWFLREFLLIVFCLNKMRYTKISVLYYFLDEENVLIQWCRKYLFSSWIHRFLLRYKWIVSCLRVLIFIFSFFKVCFFPIEIFMNTKLMTFVLIVNENRLK
jgi:hypothetical protein